MANTYANLTFHVLFSTAGREPRIGKSVQPRLWEYFSGIARQNGFEVLIAGGAADHVHLLLRLPPAMALSDAIRLLKGGSSKWLNARHLVDGRFEWQGGYGAFTVSASIVPKVADYIKGQAAHHAIHTFEAEFRGFLERSGVEFDERYWLG